MSVRNGRFGPYVTDGEANASLRKGDTPETITDERASELIQMRRERMANKGTAKKKPTKKKVTKKNKAAPRAKKSG
jgi:DNA topoisomerase-1